MNVLPDLKLRRVASTPESGGSVPRAAGKHVPDPPGRRGSLRPRGLGTRRDPGSAPLATGCHLRLFRSVSFPSGRLPGTEMTSAGRRGPSGGLAGKLRTLTPASVTLGGDAWLLSSALRGTVGHRFCPLATQGVVTAGPLGEGSRLRPGRAGSKPPGTALREGRGFGSFSPRGGAAAEGFSAPGAAARAGTARQRASNDDLRRVRVPGLTCGGGGSARPALGRPRAGGSRSAGRVETAAARRCRPGRPRGRSRRTCVWARGRGAHGGRAAPTSTDPGHLSLETDLLWDVARRALCTRGKASVSRRQIPETGPRISAFLRTPGVQKWRCIRSGRSAVTAYHCGVPWCNG